MAAGAAPNVAPLIGSTNIAATEEGPSSSSVFSNSNMNLLTYDPSSSSSLPSLVKKHGDERLEITTVQRSSV